MKGKQAKWEDEYSDRFADRFTFRNNDAYQRVKAFISKVEKEAREEGKLAGSFEAIRKVRGWTNGKSVTKDSLRGFLNEFKGRIRNMLNEKEDYDN